MKIQDVKNRMRQFNLNDWDLGGVEMTEEDYEEIALKATPENLDCVICDYLCTVRKYLDDGLDEIPEED